MKTRLNTRGHEIPDPVPFELGTRLGQAPRLSLADRIHLMLKQRQMEENDTIRDEEDLREDQFDFEDPIGDDGLLGPSPYEVPDDVPDGYSASAARKAAQEAARSKTQPSGSKEGSVEPSDGPEARA